MDFVGSLRNNDFNRKNGDADSKLVTDLPNKYDERTVKFMNEQQNAMNKADTLFNRLEHNDPKELGIFNSELYTVDASDLVNTAQISFNSALQKGLLIGTRNFQDVSDQKAMTQLARDYMVSQRLQAMRRADLPNRRR